MNGFHIRLRLPEHVEKKSFNHPRTCVAEQTGLDEKTVRDILNARTEFLSRRHRLETPRIPGIDELYLISAIYFTPTARIHTSIPW